MRLFTAILPPGHVLEGPGQLGDAVKELQALDGAAGLRWTDVANWHITLAFYGEVPEERVHGLSERLARAAGRAHPMRLRIAGGGRFADRALWAGIAGESEEDAGRPVEGVRRLASTTAAAARHAGLELDDPRRFQAHLTVARARRSAEETVDLRPYVEALGPFRGEPWTAGELALVRSNLPEGGVPGEQPRYEQIAAWPLGG